MYTKIRVVLAGVVLLMAGQNSNLMAQNKLESWYTYWGLGFADMQYPGELDDFLNVIAEVPGVSHATVGLDLLGFYWPMNPKTVLGFVINAVGDRYEFNGEHFQISGNTLALSYMHFPIRTIGKGLFIRGELGPARFVIDDGDNSDTSDWGFGGLIGAGFGFNVSPGTRILLNLNYAVRKVEKETYKTLGITLGGLF